MYYLCHLRAKSNPIKVRRDDVRDRLLNLSTEVDFRRLPNSIEHHQTHNKILPIERWINERSVIKLRRMFNIITKLLLDRTIFTSQDTAFVLFCLNIDIQREVISLYSHSIKADSDYTLRVLLVFSVKRYRPNKIVSDCLILFNWFKDQTRSKIDVRFCSIAKANRTLIVRFSSIGFLFDFV